MENEQIIKNCYGLLQAYKFCEKQKDKQEIDIKPLIAINFNDIPPYSSIKEEIQKVTKMTTQEQRQQQSVNLITKDLEQIFKVDNRQMFFEIPLRLDQQANYYQYIKYPMCFCWIRSRLMINVKHQQPLQEEHFQDENCLLKRQRFVKDLYIQFVPYMYDDNKTLQFYRQMAEKLHQAGLPPYNSYEDVFADCLMIGVNQWLNAANKYIKDVLQHAQALSNLDLPQWTKQLSNLNYVIKLVEQINNHIQNDQIY